MVFGVLLHRARTQTAQYHKAIQGLFCAGMVCGVHYCGSCCGTVFVVLLHRAPAYRLRSITKHHKGCSAQAWHVACYGLLLSSACEPDGPEHDAAPH